MRTHKIVHMAGIWGRRKAERDARAAQDADLAQRARSALVEADERIRATADELAFAVAELGDKPTRDLRVALEAVRTHLAEAFQLHQLNHDEIPDTPEELRTRNTRIVQLCEWAQELLDDRTEALAADVARVRRAPQVLEQVRRDATALRGRLPAARAVIDRLARRYAESALHRVADSPTEAEQLLEFAEHSADISARRREAGRAEEANVALETATEAVRRATTLLDGVEDFEIEALRAESTLSDVVADSRSDIVSARNAPGSERVSTAIAQLESALRALPAPGAPADPFLQLSRLREANDALDAAVAHARERAARPLPSADQVRHAVDDADRQLAVARSVIAGHRGWIGADARTRLAEAERTRHDIDLLPGDDDSRERAVQLARRTAHLADEALRLAQHDIDSSRPSSRDDRHDGRGSGDAMGGVLGGLVIGGLLGGLFD